MRISIIVPVYNASFYLRECLDSILSQSFTDYELILVNDGSTDNSLNICYEYAEQKDNIIVLSGKNSGVSAARNKGLAMAKGEWVTFVDADDLLLPDALKTLYENGNTTKADIVLSNSLRFENGKLSSPILDLQNKFSRNVLYGIKHFALWGYLIRRSIIINNHLKFVEGLAYSEDRIFLYELALKSHSILFVNVPVYGYRINPASACQSKNGFRKACHNFRAGFCIITLAKQYDKDLQTHRFLIKKGWQIVKLGLYQYSEQSLNNSFFQLKSEYNKFFNCDIRFYIYFLEQFLIVKLRQLKKKII